eukprot:scaffold15976_cov35-Prasinocladus_malaysianus.AAC.1
MNDLNLNTCNLEIGLGFNWVQISVWPAIHEPHVMLTEAEELSTLGSQLRPALRGGPCAPPPEGEATDEDNPALLMLRKPCRGDRALAVAAPGEDDRGRGAMTALPGRVGLRPPLPAETTPRRCE